jgi:hypothetical protein
MKRGRPRKAYRGPNANDFFEIPAEITPDVFRDLFRRIARDNPEAAAFGEACLKEGLTGQEQWYKDFIEQGNGMISDEGIGECLCWLPRSTLITRSSLEKQILYQQVLYLERLYCVGSTNIKRSQVSFNFRCERCVNAIRMGRIGSSIDWLL